jgi:hypothetical protein
MGYEFRELSTDNLQDLKFLYKAVFNNDVTHEFIQKKFDTGYLGIRYFGHLAYYNGKPVAFHGAIPVMMQYNQEQEIAAQYGDAMTLADHSGNGLFTSLGELTDAALRKASIRFVWGFPNQNSEYGYMKKLHWKYNERIIGFKIKTSGIPLFKIANKMGKHVSGLNRRRAEGTLGKFATDEIVSGSVYHQDDVLSVCRNRAYYKYKGFGRSFTIKIDNVLFWLKISSDLLIGDIDIKKNGNFDVALNRLENMANNLGISNIIFQTSPCTSIESLLQNHSHEKFVSWAVGYKNFSSDMPLNRLKLTFGDLDTF